MTTDIQTKIEDWGDPVEARDASTWKPEKPGESVEGTMVSIRKVKTKYGEAQIIGITQEDGKGVDVWVKAGLEKYMHAIRRATALKIRYEGTIKLESGNEMQDYTVWTIPF